MPEAAWLLRAEALVSGYGNRQVLNEVTIHVAPGEIVAVIGHNGSGKTTLLKSIFGLVPLWSGSVSVKDKEIHSPSPRLMLQAGVAYVPQGNRVFGDLTVHENLEVAAAVSRDGIKMIEAVLELFPVLAPRRRQRAASLSGGEKQMLALASGLLTSPHMLLLDEPSLGLAPLTAKQALGHIATLSRRRCISVLIIEQKVRAVLEIAERVYVLRNGHVSFCGHAKSLKDESALRKAYL